MQEFEPQDKPDERTRERMAAIRELVRDVGAELASMRTTTASEAQRPRDWERTERSAHNIAARAHALNLAVLASCARELERFAGEIAAGDPLRRITALQGAEIAIEAIDLELGILSSTPPC